jgi:trehalose 6-phosphate synthase/trehalose 6-phosphate phosphatase
MIKNVVPGSVHSRFFEAVAKAPHRLLILDYEGALTPPSAGSAPHPGIGERLQGVLKDRGTRLIVISGRPAEEISLTLGMRVAPEIWGGDGLEQLHANGHYECAELDVPKEALEALAESEIVLRRDGLGTFLEVSLAGVSVHWRGISDLDLLLDIRAKAYRVFRSIALRQASLRLAAIEGGVELRLRGATKGDALSRLFSTITIETPVAYVGNDRIDAGVLHVLSGRNLTVIVRLLPRVADTHLTPPEEFTRFLDEWIRRTQSAF